MAGRGGKLTDAMRRFIVTRLALYDLPSEVAEMLTEQFKVTITITAVRRYDPERNNQCSKRWSDLFWVVRKNFHASTAEFVPTANKAVRLAYLDKAARSYLKKGNYFGMAKMLESIAKESGGSFTNRREVTGKDGGPVEYSDVSDMTDSEIQAEMTQLFSQALAGVSPAPK